MAISNSSMILKCLLKTVSLSIYNWKDALFHSAVYIREILYLYANQVSPQLACYKYTTFLSYVLLMLQVYK